MKFASLLVSLTLLGSASAGAANLVVNGGFETPLVIGAQYSLNQNPTGWVGLGDLVVQGYAGAVNSGDGNQWLDLNPGVSASPGILQDLWVDAGTTYEFSFLYNGGGGVPNQTSQIAYRIGALADPLLAGTVSTGAMNVYFNGTPWALFSGAFTPTSTGMQALTFAPNGEWAGGFIDAVSVTALAVPEPATIALMLAGLGALSLQARRRRG